MTTQSKPTTLWILHDPSPAYRDPSLIDPLEEIGWAMDDMGKDWEGLLVFATRVDAEQYRNSDPLFHRFLPEEHSIETIRRWMDVNSFDVLITVSRRTDGKLEFHGVKSTTGDTRDGVEGEPKP